MCRYSFNCVIKIYKIKIFNSRDTIELIEDKYLTVREIIIKLAKVLDNHNESFSNILSRLHLYHNGVKLYNYNKIILHSDFGELSLRIFNEWEKNIANLRENNYNLLADFFEFKTINNSIINDNESALKIVIKLVEPVVLRTISISITNDEMEEEILEVLEDAYENNQSLYKALESTFL
jgi:hypothetical protein